MDLDLMALEVFLALGNVREDRDNKPQSVYGLLESSEWDNLTRKGPIDKAKFVFRANAKEYMTKVHGRLFCFYYNLQTSYLHLFQILKNEVTSSNEEYLTGRAV